MKGISMKVEDFFDISEFEHKDIFQGIGYMWELLEKVKKYLREHINPNIGEIESRESTLLKTYVIYQGVIIEEGFKLLPGSAIKGDFEVYLNGERLEGAIVVYSGATLADNQIYLGKGTVVEPGAYIKGPAIIGNNCEIRQGAYIRGNVLVGNKCIIGHATEVKNACFLDQAKAGHFAYIGDSILGNRVNLGAGTKLANLNIRSVPVRLKLDGKDVHTGLKKFGAILGDDVETGCNSVTNPGTMLGKKCAVYPNTTVKKGYYLPMTIIK